MSRFVYVIEAENGRIKIGSANSPLDRLATIRTHSPVQVRLIAQWEGGFGVEFELHTRFSAHRSHNEWFRVEGAVAAFVGEITGHGLDRVECWHETAWEAREVRLVRSRQSQAQKIKQIWADPLVRWERAGHRYVKKCVRAAHAEAFAEGTKLGNVELLSRAARAEYERLYPRPIVGLSEEAAA